MTDTFVAPVNKLACSEPNNFIFSYPSGCPIGDIKITRVDRDSADIIKNQSHKTLLTRDRQQKNQRWIQSY